MEKRIRRFERHAKYNYDDAHRNAGTAEEAD